MKVEHILKHESGTCFEKTSGEFFNAEINLMHDTEEKNQSTKCCKRSES